MGAVWQDSWQNANPVSLPSAVVIYAMIHKVFHDSALQPSPASGTALAYKLWLVALQNTCGVTRIKDINAVAQTRHKILLVDDEPVIRESLGRALAIEDYDVVPAANGREALEKFHSTPIDLMLLDLSLLQESGWDTFQRLRSLEPLLPVIIITAQPGQRAQSLEAGADDLMEKPLNLPLLLKMVGQLLDESPSQRAARKQGCNTMRRQVETIAREALL